MFVDEQQKPDWAVGNFTKPMDFAAAGDARGYALAADLGNGVVLFRREMMGLLVLAAAVASGWFLARALTAGAWSGPRWATLLTELALGALFGPGLASILYFAVVAMGAANRGSVRGISVALLGGSAALWWRLTPELYS